MKSNYDLGIMEDFDNMTYELGRELPVYPRRYFLSPESQEASEDTKDAAVTEVIFLQELDSKHEVVASGQYKVGDVRFTFMSDTVAEEEGYVVDGDITYKILEFTKVKNQTNNVVMYVKSYGKKVPGR